ncbi:MAG: ABC transporter permease [Spirochaetales bacterium]|nr:ABC transporter permease [Spirochaetales bacterium]
MSATHKKPFILFQPFVWLFNVIKFWIVTVFWEVIVREIILNKNNQRGFALGLGIKNLFRYKKRTFITCIAIAVGIAIYVWVDAFMIGFEEDSNRNLIDFETGTAQIMNAEYAEEKDFLPLNYTIEKPDEIIALLKKNGIPATKRVLFGGEMFFEVGSKQVKVFGIDTETNGDVFDLNDKKYLTENSSFVKPGIREIVIGAWLADTMKISLGDTVDIRARTKTGGITTLTLTVSGILNTENPAVNNTGVFMPLDIVDDALQMNGEVTDIPMKFGEWKNIDREIEKVNALIAGDYPHMVVRSYIELFGGGAIMESKRSVISLMLFLVFVIAAVGITNTMLMAVFERIREIGMMRAMGMKDSGIRLTFMFEAAGIGLLGGLIGLALGALANSYTYFIGLDFTGIMGKMEFGYRMINIFRSTWNPQTMIGAFFASILFAMGASFIPSSRALKMEVTECLRYQ